MVKKGRNGKFEATLSGTASRKAVVRFGDPGPLLARLEPGDQVTATVWRGAVMTVAKETSARAPPTSPATTPR